MTHIHSALRCLPQVPIVERVVVPLQQLTVPIEDGKISSIAAGIRALARSLKEQPVTGYVELEKPYGCACRSYGPVRYVGVFMIAPFEGDPRWVHRLDVGVI